MKSPPPLPRDLSSAALILAPLTHRGGPCLTVAEPATENPPRKVPELGPRSGGVPGLGQRLLVPARAEVSGAKLGRQDL